jgi:N-acetylglutamate synthase-like GNAT family acetyltransferase
MWFCVQMALPLFTIGLAAMICFSVASFIVLHAKPHPVIAISSAAKATMNSVTAQVIEVRNVNITPDHQHHGICRVLPDN